MTESNHGLTRRDVFRLGAAAGPGALLAACGWDGGSALGPGLRLFSRVNDWVGERIFLGRRRLAPEYPVSARTEPANFPAYSITHNETGRFPAVARPEAWALEVGGLVRKPLRLTRSMLEALPAVSYTVKHHCVEGWTAIATWTGVPVSAVLAMVEPLPTARYLRFDSFDSKYSNGWDLTSAAHPQTILAYARNDQPLPRTRGAPLRLYSPVKLGYKLTKYLRAMTLTAERHGGYWEDQGYPWLGGV